MQMQQPWLALALAHDAQQREVDRQARDRRANGVLASRPSLRRSVGRRVSRSASGSPRSHRSSWSGPDRPDQLPRTEEILS